MAGDRAIVGVADALARAATSQVGSLVSRVGGDEFVVLLRGPDRTAAIEVVDAAARRLTRLPEPVGIAVAWPPSLRGPHRPTRSPPPTPRSTARRPAARCSW
ncbi:hypothetical protein GCM10025868_39290 [Angustibacter aerolatus]|uniref:GGDEF domain-containing protein n=1 Tax=Angustibacter aerolatus TaxID=1162965 RepID=A0ABQ6JLC2_9ACTN|nr:hypothetical protein GCM10025868_39290 [Angustibacter aerolatus]